MTKQEEYDFLFNILPKNKKRRIQYLKKNKEKKEEEAPMYDKDPQPTKGVNESKEESSTVLKEEIEKIKKMASYNKKTQ